jgi:hypothetical protein
MKNIAAGRSDGQNRAWRRLNFIVVRQQSQFDLFREKIGVTERNRAVLGFHKKCEKTGISFHYHALARFCLSAAIGGSVKHP